MSQSQDPIVTFEHSDKPRRIMSKHPGRMDSIYEDDRCVGNLETSRDTKNVVIFGESGVGKSSLINLIAGKKISETSSGALGCTLEHKRYFLDLVDQHFAVWDTAGLNEGARGSVPAEKAEAYLKQLLHELAKSNGVDLLIYCVRGTRVRSALLMNYHIFYSAICRKKVPIAIAITGLENQEGNMETWWSKNEHEFSSLKMHFDGHACVTTLESFTESAILKERREIGKAAVIDMIIKTCRIQRWSPPERSWIESAYLDIRTMLTPRYNTPRLTTVIMCETFGNCPPNRFTRKRSRSLQSPVSFSFPFSFRSPISISNEQSKLPFQNGIRQVLEHQYRVYRVPRNPVSLEGAGGETGKAMVVKRGVDLLIFCVKKDETEPGAVKSQWKHFNVTYGGDLSPQIVVVVGAQDQSSAETWWKTEVGGVQVDVAYINEAEAEIERDEARKQLQHLIRDRRIDCSKAAYTRSEKLLAARRLLGLDMSSLTTLWVKPESDGKEDESPAYEQDILTKMGVWEEVQWQEQSPLLSPKESQRS